MHDAIPEQSEPALSAEQEVVRMKAAWRTHAAALTWEEKVAAIERMWERDAALRRAREATQGGPGSEAGGKE